MTDLRSQLQATLGSAYTLERELGGGGMSRVFLAEETALERKVVVKVLPPDVSAGVNMDRFKREIHVSARLQHPHVVPVLSTGVMNGIPYYTMPFVEGESLRARLIRSGALSITEAVSVLRDVARALAYAHDRGVVHRDIKPDNILLSGGSATVADFGIAKAISAARGEETGGTLTQVGTSLGTPAYMAPEQAAADPATNHRADIYAFGCVAFEVLAGRPPFVEKSPQRLLAAQMGAQPQHVSELRAEIPPELAELVMKCLEKDADARPQRASDLVHVLETVTSGGGHAALPLILTGGSGMFRKALTYYAAAFVVVLVLAQAAIIALGLPDWVLPGAFVVMLMGLPVILFTGYVQRVARRAFTATPTYTPGGTPSMQHGTMATLALKASPHVSWSRTVQGGMYAVGAFVLLVGGFMVLRALGIGPFGSLLASGKLGHREPLLITEFRAVNADSTLGSVISQAVRANLEQSSAITVVPQSSVASGLQRMQQPSNARLDLTLAQQLAVREGTKAIVDGEVAGIGTGYLLTLRLVSADSGRELASFREAADGPKQLIAAVDVLSRKLRGKIGESLREVRASPPLEQVTTGSIEALKKYTEATKATGVADWIRAAALAREAVAIDTGFALAYRHLSESLVNAFLPRAASDSAITRAFRMRDRLTERERLAVIGDYYSIGPGRDRSKAIEAFERQVALGDYSNTNSLGMQLQSRRDFARAESLANIRIRLEPDRLISYSNLIHWQIEQGRIGAAESTLALVRSRFPNHPIIASSHATLLTARDSFQRASSILDSAQRRNAGQMRAFQIRYLAAIAWSEGRLKDAERLLRTSRAIDSVRGVATRVVADSMFTIRENALLFGSTAAHTRRIEAVANGSAFARSRDYFEVAKTFAIAGRPDRARAFLARYDAEVTDTSIRRFDRPQLDEALAEIALAENRVEDALSAFRRADSLPDGPSRECAACVHANLARAFDRGGQSDSVITAIEQLFSAGSTDSRLELNVAVFEKRLGELYEQRGDRQKAYSHYARFVTLWKNADPELQPRVAEVRRRMIHLQDVERR